ncbi:MAG: NUDIX domain-containing protein [Spirochaetales bacterium]|nr:NUDIX domain-containing protein [Spirochaetales bacterium]
MNGENTAIPASYLYLEREGKILLLKRKNTGYMDGYYSLVAGHVERGESFSECLIREAREEAGLTIKPEDVEFLHVSYRNDSSDFSNQRMDVFFTARKWEGSPVNLEPHKCEELAWFPKDQIPEKTIPYIRDVLECIHGNRYFSEGGWV